MRKLGVMLAAVAMIAFGLAGTASAAPLQWEGTLLLELGTLPSIPGTGGGVATITDTGGGHIGDVRLKASRGGVTTSNFAPVTDPGAVPIKGVNVQATMLTGTLGDISGGQGSTPLAKVTLPVGGLAKVCLGDTTCNANLPLDLTQTTGTPNAPGALIGVGIGGLLTIGGKGTIKISIEAAPWTIKEKTSIDQITTPVGGTFQTFVVRKAAGFAHDPSSGTSSTGQPSGVVQLISPMQVRTNLSNGSNQKIALFAKLTVHFIPEPGMLLLLGSGVAGLVLLGRHRMRK